MKYLLATLMLMTLTMPAFARNIVVALSPSQNPIAAKEELTEIINLLNALDGGDAVIVVDGHHLKTIATLHVPTEESYQSPKARIAKNRKEIASLVRFTKGVSSTAAPNLRLPQLLRFVADNYAYKGKMDVAVLGSPFYDDPKEPASSMLRQRVPSDGHLNVGHKQSVYGAGGNKDGFKNIRLHIGFNDESIFGSDQHRFFVKRFWALFTLVQGGELATFTADKGLLFERVLFSAPAPKYDYTQGKETTLEMIRILGAREEHISIFEREISTQALPAEIISSASNVEIGISWDVDADLDLHARAFPGAQVLYFNRKSTPEGTHLKDYISSPSSENAFETIIFHKPVDLKKLKIGVYVFSGVPMGLINAKLRLAAHGQVYERAFTLSSVGIAISSKKVLDARLNPRVRIFKLSDIIGG